MRPPSATTRMFHNHPITPLNTLNPTPRGNNLSDALIAGYSGRLGCSERGCKGRFGGIHALDLVDVGGVYGGGEEAER